MWWALFWAIVLVIGYHNLPAGIVTLIAGYLLVEFLKDYFKSEKTLANLQSEIPQVREILRSIKEKERLESLITNAAIEKTQKEFEDTLLSPSGYPGALDPRQSAVYLKMKSWYKILEEKSRHLDNTKTRKDWLSYLESLEGSNTGRWMLGESYEHDRFRHGFDEKSWIEKVTAAEKQIDEIEERFPKMIGENAIKELSELRVRDMTYPSGVPVYKEERT